MGFAGYILGSAKVRIPNAEVNAVKSTTLSRTESLCITGRSVGSLRRNGYAVIIDSRELFTLNFIGVLILPAGEGIGAAGELVSAYFGTLPDILLGALDTACFIFHRTHYDLHRFRIRFRFYITTFVVFLVTANQGYGCCA